MRNLYIFCLLILGFQAAAQTEFSVYRMHANLPQANMINPAFSSNHKLVIGLPVVSSIRFSFDNDNIAFRDLFRTSETDSLALDTVSIFSKLKEQHRMKFNEGVQLFYLGLRGKKGFFSFAIHQVSETRLNYPGDLIGWAIRGPGNHAYVGKPLDFGNFYGKSIAYNKISVNYARDITPVLRVGVRLGYLLGIAAGETSKINGSLTMGVDSVSVNTGRIKVQTAGFDFFDQDDLDASDYQNYFLKSKNRGMSIDLGGSYDLTDNLTISAAVNDLGYISWKDYTRTYEVAPINYTFRGFDLLDYINKEPGDEFLKAELDSLENLYDASETTGGKFKTPLIGKFYAGVNFKVLKVNNFSALVYFDMFQKRIDPAVSLGYNLQLGRTFNATVGVTYQNGKINNVGAGLAIKLTHLQIYMSSDRANSFVYPARASRADAHVGMNFVFGKARKNNEEVKKKEEEPVEEEQDSVVTVPVTEVPAETPSADTVQASAPVQPDIQPQVQQDTLAQPVAVPAIVEETVTQGVHEEELRISHYVIVGTFLSRENAERYSTLLKNGGYDNSFGFVTDKNVFHVYVHKSNDIEEARRIRDQYRKLTAFQFSSSWVLTVEE